MSPLFAVWFVCWPALAGVQGSAPEQAGSQVPAPEQAGSQVSAPAGAQLEEFRAVRVEVVGFDEGAVLTALRLRLPQLEVDRHGASPPQATPHAYVQVTRGEGDAGRLRVITSDGRAYERSFVIEVGQEVRVVASTAANLLFSIEQGAVAPDQEDVAIPAAEPAAESVEVPKTEVPVLEAPPPVITREPPTPERPVRVEPPGWELGVGFNGAAVLGVAAPAYGGAFVGAGGGLGIEARAGNGGVVALDVRGLGRGTSAYTVGRVRVGVAGGYAWRRGRFELPVLVGASLEPWWAGAQIYSGATAVTRAPLIGGYLRVTPAVRLAVGRGPLAAVRLGPRVEVGGSFAVDGGAQVVGLEDPAGASRVRLGGLELSVGLEVALQWSLGRRAQARR